MTVSAGNGRKVLIIVENLPLPFDRRVWQEANTLREAGYGVAIICPVGKGAEARYECLNGIHIYRHPLPTDADGPLGYLIEYSAALFWEFWLSWRVLRRHGFDVVHACNPPDLIFLVGGFFKLFFGKKFLFDHHDINPELYEAKFGQRGLPYKLIRAAERWSFRTADVSIATNESYKRIALGRGRMSSDRVYVVRSGPMLDRLRAVPPQPALRNGRRFLVGYVGVMGKQEGIHLLLESVAQIVHGMKRHDIQFGLVGGGTELEPMKVYASKLGIERYVTFTGRVADDELLAMLSTADVCVNPDVPNEMNDKSTMNKVMEYMALGKPIVQFDLTEGRFSAQEASAYAANGNITDFASQIVALLDNPLKREHMGAFGRQRVENVLEWKYEAPKLLRAYESLFESNTVLSGAK